MQRRPDALKLITGTARPDRARADSLAAALVPLDAVPEPPSWLTAPAAITEWQRLAPRLVACRTLSDAMLTMLAHYCAGHAALVAIYERGEEPRAALLAQVIRLAGEFGCTPASATKIPKAETPATENRFAGFRPGAA